MEKLTKTAVDIFFLTILAKMMGFLKEMIMAYKFGTTYIVDAYTIATAIPSVVFSIVVSGMAESYVTVWMRIDTKDKKRNFYNTLQSISFLVSIVATIVCVVCSPYLTRIFAPGLTGEELRLTSKMIRDILFIFPIMVVYNFIAGNMRAQEHFLFFNFCDTIVVNAFLILSIVMTMPQYPEMLAFGYVVATGVALMMTWIYSEKKELQKFSWNFCLKNPELKELIFVSAPVGLSLFANQINAVIDRGLASSLGEGAISSLNYANRMQLLVLGFTTVIFSTVCYPRMVRYFALGNKKDGEYYGEKGVMLGFLVGIPITIYLLFYGQDFVRILFERGVFDRESTKCTAICLKGYVLGLSFYGIRDILTKVLAANKKQSLIMKNSIIAICINIILNLVLVKPLRYLGLALATSISGFCACILMYIDLLRIGISVLKKIDIWDIAKLLGISLLCVVVMNSFMTVVSGIWTQNVSYIVATIISVLVFIILCMAFRIRIFLWIMEKIISMRRKED